MAGGQWAFTHDPLNDHKDRRGQAVSLGLPFQQEAVCPS